MAELIVSGLGLIPTVFVGWWVACMVKELLDNQGDGLLFLVLGTALLLDCLLGIYLLVRFTHWCWVTPIPQMPFLPH